MFNPNDHMMKLKGKDYLQVAWRLVWFREDHPDWSIEAKAITIDEEHAIFKAVICDENGLQKSCGHGSESKRDFGDFIEKAETKAIGRALAMLGYGTQFAGNELDEGSRIVDSPIDRGIPEDLPKKGAWNPVQAISAWVLDHGMSMAEFSAARLIAIQQGQVENIPGRDLTEEQAKALFEAIEKNGGA